MTAVTGSSEAGLREGLRRAWSQAKSQYRSGRINSERTLQAVLFGELKAAFPDLKIFCEPTIPLSGETVVPDIVIVGESRTVVAVIELKFVPHHYPVFEADMEKLRRYGDFRGEFHLTVQATTGHFDEDRYKFDPECLLVFAAVGQHDAKAVDASGLIAEAKLGTRFVPLTCPVGGDAEQGVGPDDRSPSAPARRSTP